MTKRRPPRVRPLALSAVALVSGLVLGLGDSDIHLIAAGLLAATVAGLAARLLSEKGPLVAAVLLGIAAGGALIGMNESRRAAVDCRRGWESGERVELHARAIGFLPTGERGSVRLRPEPEAEVECEWAGDVRAWTEGPVRPGTLYRLNGVWQPARTPGRSIRAPDRWGWLSIDSLAVARSTSLSRNPFLTMRGALAERLWRVYPRRWAPLAQALVLGQRETLGKETTNRIARSGLAHLLAISGLHVGMLAAALFGMGRMARLTTDGARLFTVVLTSGYVLLIGAPPSAVRAGLMVVLWTLTRVAGRASSAFDVLGLAALILLLARPWSVVEPGFQLSFAGAAAVGYASGEARALTTRGRLPGALNGIAVGMITSTAAVLLTAPITAAFFGRVAPAAIVGNVVAIPLLALALPALFASAALAPWPALAAWPAAAAVIVLRCIDHVAGILASAPWASFELSPPGLLPALCYLVLLVLGAHAVHGAWQRRRLILAIGIAGSIAVSWPALRSRMEPGGLAVFVLDVGQGEAIAVRTPNRRWLLIDAGPKIRDFDAGERRVLPFFRERGVRRLSAWIASHPDLDHVGGFPAIADKLDVDRVVAVDHVSGQVGLVELLRAIARDSIPWLHADSGDRLEVDGLELRFLHPAHDRRGGSAPANELSLVFLLQYGKFRMLFTGDVPGTVEDELSRFNPETVRAHVLKVSHHGSASSTSRSFLNAVRPELAVISVGRGNRYGHPSQHTIYRLSSTRVPVLRTDRAGTIVIDARMDGTWTSRLAAEGF